MSQVMGTPIIKNLTEHKDKPYDGTENILPDRQGGWKVNHPMLDEWIIAVPTRPLADQIFAAFEKISEKAYASGSSESLEAAITGKLGEMA